MDFLSSAFHTVVPLIVLLGILIFVHELGHFSVAKYFGVRVEVFSLGFGRKLLKKKYGDTEYCLSAIPFGGYVKMYGDDPSMPVPVDQQKYSFSHKPVGPRIAVVLAGPLMNFFFAWLVFSLISVVGEETLRPVVGDVPAGSAAFQAGFRPGDEVKRISGTVVDKWDDLKKIVENNANQNMRAEVIRGNQTLEISFTPKAVPNKNVLSDATEVGDLDGLNYLARAPVIGISSTISPAYKAGLRTFDVIESVDGVKVNTWREAQEILSRVAPQNTVRIEATRLKDINDPNGAKTPLNATVTADGDGSLGLENSELFLSKVVEGSPAQMAGLEIGDRIVSVANQPIDSWDNVIKTVQSYKPDQPAIQVVYLRNGTQRRAEILPRLMAQTSVTGEEQKNFALGVITGLAYAAPSTYIQKVTSPVAAISKGLQDTWNWTILTAKSFAKLAQRKVSAKSIGGPLMIGKLASDTWKIGLSAFLKIMGIISINLFLLNLLPIPVLDGGHLLFFSIELFKGSPLSFRKLEIMQQMGMALLLALMIFAVFNDLSRFFHSPW